MRDQALLLLQRHEEDLRTDAAGALDLVQDASGGLLRGSRVGRAHIALAERLWVSTRTTLRQLEFRHVPMLLCRNAAISASLIACGS